MVKSHLKRVSAPRTWDIPRKKTVFITRPLPGGHSFDYAMSLSTVMKEVLKLCTTTREVKFMIHNKDVLIDGVPCHDEKMQVGFMDVLSIPKLGKSYRMVLNSRGKLSMVEISDKEAGIKIVRVSSKTSLKGKKLQAGLSDGRSVLLGKHNMNVGDSVILSVPKQEINGTLKLGAGATVLFTAGSYAGGFGTIASIKDGMVTFKDESGEHETRLSYAFVVGENGKIAVKMS